MKKCLIVFTFILANFNTFCQDFDPFLCEPWLMNAYNDFIDENPCEFGYFGDDPYGPTIQRGFKDGLEYIHIRKLIVYPPPFAAFYYESKFYTITGFYLGDGTFDGQGNGFGGDFEENEELLYNCSDSYPSCGPSIPTFTDVTPINFPRNESTVQASIGDIDNNGFYDIIMGNAIYYNKGGNSWDKRIFGVENNIGTLTDYNRDGWLDYYKGNLYFNNDQGQMIPAQSSIPRLTADHKLIDVKNDGSIFLLNNTDLIGPCVFTSPSNCGGVYLSSNTCFDFNNKSQCYLGINSENKNQVVSDGKLYTDYSNNGSFVNLRVSGFIKNIDLDNDKQNDFVSWDELNTRNLIIDIPNKPLVDLGKNNGRSFNFGDFNNDGNIDILNRGIFYQNSDQLTFIQEFHNFDPEPDGLRLIDFDNDGDLDVLQISCINGARLFRNESTIKNQKPNKPQNLQANVTDNKVVFAWTHGGDDLTNYPTYNLYIKNLTTNKIVYFPHSDTLTGQLRLLDKGNCEYNNGWFLQKLPPGQYRWKVQAVDQGYLGSEWTLGEDFVIAEPICNTEIEMISLVDDCDAPRIVSTGEVLRVCDIRAGLPALPAVGQRAKIGYNIVSCGPSTCNFAQTQIEITCIEPLNSVQISLPSKSANHLDTFSVPVIVKGFPDVYAFQFPVTWDTLKLQYIKVHSINLPGAVSDFRYVTIKNGETRFLHAYSDPLLKDTIFKIQFKALSNKCDSTIISFTNNTNFEKILVDWNGKELTTAFTDSKIKFNQTLCNDCTHPDYAPLMALYNSTSGSGWTNNTGWKEGAEGSSCDPCNFNGAPWYGIRCENGIVVEIIISNNQLKGTLPDIKMPNLEDLALHVNNLEGRIPNFDLPNLETLELGQNKFSGNIPNFNLPKLGALYLYSNQLTGTIPDFNLPNLSTLILQKNQLSGNIPNFKLNNLTRLYIDSNQLTGIIPTFNFTNLNALILNDNLLEGAIPIFNLPDLWYLDLHSNNLQGCIPEYLCDPKYFIDLTMNSQLPWQGDITRFCNGESQTDAPCDDGNPDTSNDKIQEDCSCRGCTSSTFMQSFSICGSESVIVGNSTYALGGTYIDTLQSSFGCDSIITTIITQVPIASLTQNIQICQNESFTIGNNTYSVPGIYIDTLQSFIGCDSIITTTITQKQNTSLSQNIQICQGESISVGANTYISNGTYVDTLISRNGCDSVVSTILNVLQTPKIDNMIAICSGQSHQVGNKTYTQSGNYIDTLQSIFGCDSIISTFLTVRPSQNISFNTPDKICKGTYVNLSVIALGTYLWSDGQTSANISEILNANKTYQVTVTDQFGCAASSSVSITVVEPKIKAIPIADTLILCFKDTIINPYSLLAQFDANGTWTLDEKNISGQPFNLMELTEGIHTFNYGFTQQAPCSDMDTSFILLIKDCRIIDCSFTLIDDSIRVNKNEASTISLIINDILPEEYIISNISVDPDVLESTNLSDEGLYSFTVTGDFGDIVQVVYEICTPDCTDCKQASLWIDNEALKDIIRTNIILPNTSGKNATLRFTDEEFLKDSELYIFNRNGDRIFHMKDYDNSWNADGYPGGIYFYMLRYKGVDIKKTLTVMK